MTYTDDFYTAESNIAYESARVVLPVVLARTGATRIIDVGCGTGGWAKVAAELCCTVDAVDHDVPRHLQLLDVTEHDLNDRAYPCTGYDLAICLEVAEHLEPDAGPHLIRGLSEAGAVLFSAATPGQPGVGHINCAPHAYWHSLFARYGMVPEHIGAEFTDPVADFYVRNMYLYTR